MVRGVSGSGGSPISPGVPQSPGKSFVPGVPEPSLQGNLRKSRGARESRGFRSPLESPLALEPKRFPGSGGNSISPGVPRSPGKSFSPGVPWKSQEVPRSPGKSVGPGKSPDPREARKPSWRKALRIPGEAPSVRGVPGSPGGERARLVRDSRDLPGQRESERAEPGLLLARPPLH